MLSLLPFLVPLFGCAWHSAANFVSLCNASVSPPTREALAAGLPSYMRTMMTLSLFRSRTKMSVSFTQVYQWLLKYWSHNRSERNWGKLCRQHWNGWLTARDLLELCRPVDKRLAIGRNYTEQTILPQHKDTYNLIGLYHVFSQSRAA